MNGKSRKNSARQGVERRVAGVETSRDIAVSVVIPTYNRIETLPEVLSALEAQTESERTPPFEIIVVDDGSHRPTERFLTEWKAGVPALVLRQENSGPAAARNRGIEAGSGRWVAFLGDDTVPQPGWLAAHYVALESATKQRIEPCVLGYTRWHRRMSPDPFLHYINRYGLQFGYALIEDPEEVPFNFFYTSNLSLRRELMLKEPFDEAFPFAAWEDTEVSYRLRDHGLHILYRPGAVVEHDHPTDLERFCERQRKAGYSAVVFYRRHPELAGWLGLSEENGPPVLPSAWQHRLKSGLAGLLARPLQMASVSDYYAERKPPDWLSALWEDVLRYHYIQGLNQAWQDGAR